LVFVFSFLWFKSSVYSLVSFGHCTVCSLIYVSDYYFGIFWSLSCLFFDLRLLITLWYLLVIVLSVLWFTFSDYHFGIFCSLSCLFFDLSLLITLWYLLVNVLSVLWFMSSDYPFVSFGHCLVCSLIYVFWLPLWYLLSIVLFVLWFTSSDYHFGIFLSLLCLFFDLRLLVIPLVVSQRTDNTMTNRYQRGNQKT
jgi:hypothetical protein